MAGFGSARHGRVRLGMAGFGEEPSSRRIGLMMDCYGSVRSGLVRLVQAGQGLARNLNRLEGKSVAGIRLNPSLKTLR
jgi:hypothetical protein